MNPLAEWWRVSRLSFQILKEMVTKQGLWRTLGFAWLGISHALRGRGLPHTPEVNAALWTVYDWSRQGEEWSKDPAWEALVVQDLLAPHVPSGSRVLEIGPGAGRWTQYLVQRASRLVIVDVTPRCIELCRTRFHRIPHIEYVVNNGCDLSFLPAESIDRIWSWDVFIHVGVEDIQRYIRQFSRVLTPGGRGLIQHAHAPYAWGWRSPVSMAQMADLCRDAGLTVAEQFQAWHGGRMTTPKPADMVTVFAKPARDESSRAPSHAVGEQMASADRMATGA